MIEICCEYNEEGYLFTLMDFPGAYLRGKTENEALAKLGGEIRSYQRWRGDTQLLLDPLDWEITERILSAGQVSQGQSTALFRADCAPLSPREYQTLKLLVLRSARDLRRVYEAIPNPDISGRQEQFCYYGRSPRTPRDFLERINSLTTWLLTVFGLHVEAVPDVYGNRLQALSELEDLPDFLACQVYTAPDGEEWTLRKALRRFLWCDRLYGKALWRTATALWGSEIPNPFHFL